MVDLVVEEVPPTTTKHWADLPDLEHLVKEPMVDMASMLLESIRLEVAVVPVETLRLTLLLALELVTVVQVYCLLF